MIGKFDKIKCEQAQKVVEIAKREPLRLQLR
jgi:hypothetical protein